MKLPRSERVQRIARMAVLVPVGIVAGVSIGGLFFFGLVVSASAAAIGALRPQPQTTEQVLDQEA